MPDKTVMKSFRLNSRVADSLSKISHQRKFSESSYVSKLLESSLKADVLFQFGEGIRLNEPLFQSIISSTNATSLEFLASEFAGEIIPYSFELLELESSLSSLEYFLCEILQECGWFKVDVKIEEECHELKFIHRFGPRWSIFLKSFLNTALEKTLHTRAEVVALGRIVKVHIPRENCELSTR